jgi:hypothetical protein
MAQRLAIVALNKRSRQPSGSLASFWQRSKAQPLRVEDNIKVES